MAVKKEKTPEYSVWPSDWKKLALFFITYKIVFYAIAYFSFNMMPPMFQMESWKMNMHYPQGSQPLWWSPLATWDGQHFLKISNEGYKQNDSSSAFYPLFPAILWVAKQIGGSEYQWFFGLLFSNLFGLAGFIVFFQLARDHFGEKVAWVSTTLLLSHPGAVAFQVMYTESVYFFFDMLFVSNVLKNRFEKAAIFAFFLPLTRATGVFAIPAFFVAIFTWWRAQGQPKNQMWKFALVLTPILGLCTHFFNMYLQTGNALEGFAANRFFAGQPKTSYLFDVVRWVEITLNPNSIHGYMGSFLDRTWVLILIPLLIFVWMRLPKWMFFYCAPLIWVGAAYNSYVSMTRYLVLMVPLFLAAGIFFNERKDWKPLGFAVGVLVSIQMLILIRYMNFMWSL